MLFYIYINIDLNKIHINWNRSVDCFKGQSSSSDIKYPYVWATPQTGSRMNIAISQAEETSFISRT